MKVTAPDDTKWRVGRRIFPWSLRRPRHLVYVLGVFDFEDIGCLLSLLGLIPMSIYWLIKVTVGLLITPFLLLCDVLHLRRRRVVAFRIEPGFVDKVVEWRRPVNSRAQVRRVREAAAHLLSRSYPQEWGVMERLAYIDAEHLPPQHGHAHPPQHGQPPHPAVPPTPPNTHPHPPRSAVWRRDDRRG